MVGLDIQRRKIYVSGGESYVLPPIPSDEDEMAFVRNRKNMGVSQFRIYSDPEYPFAQHDNFINKVLAKIGKTAEPEEEYFYLDEELNVWAPLRPRTSSFSKRFNLGGIVRPSFVLGDTDVHVPVSVEFSENTNGPRISLCGGGCECSRVVDGSEGILVDHNLGPGDKKLIVLGALAYNDEIAEGKNG